METFHDQAALASYCSTKLSRQIERARALVADLSPEQRRQPREHGGWSIDQILEHLATINGQYIDQIGRVEDAADASGEWSPTLAGRFLRWTVTTPRKLKTPRIFEPQPLQASDNALKHFAASQSELLDLIERYQNVSWKKARTSSPASPIMRLNLGDCFLILADHGERHLSQIEEQRAALTGAHSASPGT